MTHSRLASWKFDAACRYEDPALWFPKRAEGEVNRGEDGKAICARCPVVETCLRAAIHGNEKQGVWGGAGEPTRRRLSKLTRGRGAEAHPPGCACLFCIAIREHVNQLRHAYLDEGSPNHGTWQAFLHAGCRCGDCTAAYRRSGRAPRRGRTPAA